MFKILRKKSVELERRKYLRLNSVFPVELQVLDSQGTKALSVWMQGFTSNVSLGGMCISLNNVQEETIALLTQKDLQISLCIHIPLSSASTKASASISWISKIKGSSLNQYQIGVKYLVIDKAALKRIMRYTNWFKFSFQSALTAALIFLLAFSIVFLHNLKLRLENRNLIERLLKSAQKYDLNQQELNSLALTKEELMKNLSADQNKIKELEVKMQDLQAKLQKGWEQKSLAEKDAQFFQKEIERLKQLISIASQEKASSQEKISKVQERQEIVSQELASTNNERQVLKQAALSKMLKWLSTHQNNRTGLILSYEGDNNLKDWAFIYDESLVAQVFVLFDDYERAKKIFNFFNSLSTQEKFSGFYNAYYASSGDVAEYTIHAGPNIWLGIAMMQYTHKTNDLSYLPLAKKIAGWLISLQEQDREGGLRGGPRVTWFSTEHNLDGFAFFNMLYEATKDKKYALASKKILSWLTTHAYGGYAPPIKRGKGDSTVATDTYAWSIAALGPKLLNSISMDPDKIMEFAEENCGVTVNFKRQSGETVEVKGFDFAKYTNMPRGGVISSEWTAQMALSYLVLSDYYAQEKNAQKKNFYQDKALFYLNELNKLIISSPSPTGQGEGCLPYATSEDVDTGHGWRTPKGSSTGSIAATCYTIFAQKNYNPLQISQKAEQ